jgi:hypothetical protein
MSTTCGISVTKNSDGTYTATSSDATNGVGWIGMIPAGVGEPETHSAVQQLIWNEILRQIRQI